MSHTPNMSWVFTERGELSKILKLEDAEVDPPKTAEITIEVYAVAVNPVDVQIAMSGDLTLRILGGLTHQPKVPAFDFSGVVHAIGEGVTSLSIGDEVFGLNMNWTGNGCLRKYVTVPLNSGGCTIVRKPASLDHIHAAAIPLVYSTVHTALVQYGKLGNRPEGAKRRSVLVLGGSGGTGSLAIQLAKQLGCDVVTTCSKSNVDFVKKTGADEVIDYTSEHVAQATLHSHHAPFSVILDCVGGTELIPYLDHLILDDPEEPQLGIYVTIVGDKIHRDTMGGPITNIFNPIQSIRTARGHLTDALPRWMPLRNWIASKRYACIMLQASVEQFESIPKFIEKGGKVIIDSVYSFEDAKKAYERLESGRSVGKVIINVKDTHSLSSGHAPSVAYLGPEGSYSHQAAISLAGARAQLKPRTTITDVFRSDTDLAVIPLENTIHGVVQETLRCFCEEADAESSKMAQSRWEIVGDTDLAVQHALVVRKGTKLEDVTWVGSHEQALGQCSNYLAAHLPRARRGEFVSTATAASFLASRETEDTRHGAAICSQAIADKLSDRLELVAKGIQNVKANHTRFLLLKRRRLQPTGIHTSTNPSCTSFFTLDEAELIPLLGERLVAVHSRAAIREAQPHARRYLVEVKERTSTLPDGVTYLGST